MDQQQKPPQFNYFPTPTLPPTSSSSSSSISGNTPQQPPLNPFLLPNGAPTFRMPSLDALRPPPSFNFSTSKLITNPSVLQPPPSLNKTITNPLLTNPLLQKELPKFTPMTTPTTLLPPKPFTTSMNIQQKPDSEQNQTPKTENNNEDDSFFNNSNKSVSSINSLKNHDPLLNSFNQNFQQIPPPINSQQTPSFMSNQQQPPLYQAPPQFNPTNYNQQFSTSTPPPLISNQTSPPSFNTKTLSPSIANVNLPQSINQPPPPISNFNKQTPPMFQSYDQRQTSNQPQTPSPSIANVNLPSQASIQDQHQQVSETPSPLPNQDETTNESQKQDSASIEEVSSSHDESNGNNSSLLNESTTNTTTTTTTATTTTPSSDSNNNLSTVDTPNNNPQIAQNNNPTITSFPQEIQTTQNVFNTQSIQFFQNQPQQLVNRPTFTPTPFKPAPQTPVNFSPVPTQQQQQPQIPRFGPPQQSSTAPQSQFFTPTPLRPLATQPTLARPQFMSSQATQQQPPLFIQQPHTQQLNQANAQLSGPPFLQNRQFSAPPTSNIQQQSTSGQMSSPPTFINQQQPPFPSPPATQPPTNMGPPTTFQQQPSFPPPPASQPPANMGPPTSFQQQPPTQPGFIPQPQANMGPPAAFHNQPPPTQSGFITQPPANMGPPLASGPPLSSNQNKPPTTQLQYKYPSATSGTTTPSIDSTKSNMPFQQTALPQPVNQLASQLGNIGIKGQKPLAVDLIHEKRLLQPYDDNKEIPRPKFPHDFYTNVNCHPDIIRSTLTAMPESANLLSKCRLPLGILIHPFKDLESLKVVQSSTIVRCRNCRSYINPFVHFLDNTKWRCNLCYSVNDLPDEFLFDPVTRSYGDPSKRPEITSSTIEFIAPAEYTLRPPPPAMYLFLLDVSHNAVNTGYLQNACDILLECLDKLPGDTRTQIGFITYNSSIHFYNLSDSLSQPQMLIYPDIDDVVLPLPENLMINLTENKETIQTFLQDLPNLFNNSNDTENALGTALTAAFKLLTGTGGRVTVMQTCLPTCGVGSLKIRSDSIEKDSQSLGPQTDFYKKLALECASVHIAVDLFMFNALYADLATLSCISKYSGGEIKYYPEFHLERYPEQSDRFCFDFKRYLTRKIGFEAVMRVRCTRGLSIHTFHGNFFVRSTDLLALPNVNPDAGFGMQISIDESLTDVSTICFQAALLYTSSKSERRIRIHTYCLPVSSNLNEIINGADQEAVICLVAKMAVDRSIMNSVKEAKDALTNVAIDYLNAYSSVVTKQQKTSLLSPYSLRLVPLYVLALMKSMGFKYGNVKIDDRSYTLNVYKSMPLKYLMLYLYPNLYAVHNIDNTKTIVDSDTEICLPPSLHLSSESIDRHGVYILDACESIYMWIGRSVNDQFLQQVFNVKSFNELPDHATELPELENVLSERIRNFIVYLYDQRPFGASFIFFREDSIKSHLFFQHIIEDKTESSISYVEFIRYLNDQVSKN